MTPRTEVIARPSTGDELAGLPRVSVNGTSLAYREQGLGEPVVFVHGSAGDLRSWEQQLPAIGRSRRAVAYSRRYARPNADIPPGVDDQMHQHVDDLVATLEALDAAPAHLVGHSWGGFICLLAAIHHPGRVRSLVLEEPPVLTLFVGTPPRPMELLPLLVRRPRTALGILRFGAGAFEPARKAFLRGDDAEGMRLFASGVLGSSSFERVPEERRRQMQENLAAVKAQITGAGFPPLLDEEVRAVAHPTLLVTGERSPAVFHGLSRRLAELLPNAEGVEVPSVSHRLHEENPAAVNEAILSFLGRVPS